MLRVSAWCVLLVCVVLGCGEPEMAAPVPGVPIDSGAPGEVCGEDERGVGGSCVACPPGTSNQAGDAPALRDTACDAVACPELSEGINVVSGCACTAGASGEVVPAVGAPYFEGGCTAESCGVNEFVSGNECLPCFPGTANPAGDDATQADTACSVIICGEDHRVRMHMCVACPPGSQNTPGDDASGVDTQCDSLFCDENERVREHRCVACDAGSSRSAGDEAVGEDTACEPAACPTGSTGMDVVAGCTCQAGYTGVITPSRVMPYYEGECVPEACTANEFVMSNACVSCPAGSSNAPGDDPSGPDTECDAVPCPAGSTGASVASGCTCNPGTAGSIVALVVAPYFEGACVPVVCAVNERVISSRCVACPVGTTNVAGDDASGLDTACDAFVMISEVGRNMTSDEYEALEIYNHSTVTAVDLSGWSVVIYDGGTAPFGTHTFAPGTSFGAGETLGLIEQVSSTRWYMDFPAEGALVDYEFSFNWTWDSGDGAVVLLNASGEVVDVVAFGSFALRSVFMPTTVPGPLWSRPNVGSLSAAMGVASSSWQRMRGVDTNAASDWAYVDKTWGRLNR